MNKPLFFLSAAIAVAITTQACIVRTLRWETAFKSDAEGTVTHEKLTIRHRGLALVPSELYVAKQDCLMQGKPVIPEVVVAESTKPKDKERQQMHVVVWEKITVTNNTEHLMHPFSSEVTKRPHILMLDGKQERHDALSRANAIKILEEELPCTADLFKRTAFDKKLNYFDPLDPVDRSLELLPGVDWTGYVAYEFFPTKGGNNGRWTFGFYDMPVFEDPTGGFRADLGARTGSFSFTVDVNAFVDHYKGDVRQASFSLPDVQTEDSL